MSKEYTQLEKDYELLVIQKRHSIRNYGAAALKACADLTTLLAERQLPFRQKDRGIYEGIRTIGEFSRQRDIGSIALIDKSARPLWVGVSEYWKLAYSDELHPDLSFINPAMYRHMIEGSQSPEDLESRMKSAAKVTLEQMDGAGSPLPRELGQPLLLFDSCMHTGRAVHLTKRVLELAGFEDVKVGVIKTTLGKDSPMMPDIYGSSSVLKARCFRSEPENNLVINSQDSIYSQRTELPTTVEEVSGVRRSIRDIVREGYAADHGHLAS